MSMQPQASLWGMSHKTAPLDVLGRLAFSNEQADLVHQKLVAHEQIDDALVLSTCNRTEIYTFGAAHKTPPSELASLTQATLSDLGQEPSKAHFYESHGKAALEHLFRVSCGLDSMILGEAQILGQLKSAYESARRLKQPSAYFDRLMQAAFKVSKRSRSETDIGKGAVSIASAGVHLASRIFSDLSKRSVAVVGAGDTGRIAAEHFAKHGPQNLWILNRTKERAETLARMVHGEALTLDALPMVLHKADVVVVAVSVKTPLITLTLAEPAIRQRAGRPLALVDLGLPRNIDTTIDKLLNTFVNDLDTLKRVVDQNLEQRRREVPRVEGMISAQVEQLLAWQSESRAAPLIASLRQRVEAFRQREVEKASAKLSPTERAAVERVTRSVINKLLHGPMTSIKAFAREQEAGAERLHLIRDMFQDLAGEADPEDNE